MFWHKLYFKESRDRVPSKDKQVELCRSSGASRNQAAGAQRNRPWHKLHFKVSQDRVPSKDKRVQLCGSSGVSKLGDG